MRGWSGTLGLLLGSSVAAIVACGGAPQKADWQQHLQRSNEITALWTQIRDWRREAGMELDPTPQNMFQSRDKTVREVAKACPDGHQVPTTCGDVCSLADAICDNAEAICSIADELGKSDDFAQQKCTSAKASCREAKQRCCECSGDGT